jgi:hypothetical protein
MRKPETRADLLMLTGVTARCADCGDQRVFMAVDDPRSDGEFCCTSCDAAVFLMLDVSSVARSGSRAA